MVWWLNDRDAIVLMMSKECHKDRHETYIWWLHVKEKHNHHGICNACFRCFTMMGISIVVIMLKERHK